MKKTKSNKAYKILFSILSLTVVFLLGCSLLQKRMEAQIPNPISATDLKVNSVVSVTIYDSDDTAILDECMALCDKYEKIFSRTDEGSELYRLNHRLLSPVSGTDDTYELSEPLAELLSIGLSYSQACQGAFDITIAPLTSLWDFTAQTPLVPDEEDILTALASCGYENVVLKGQLITLPSPDTQFDLGGIAKGYIADRLKEYLLSRQVKSALINLGGNVLCVGEKINNTPFKIGVQKPFAQRGENLLTVSVKDKSVVSSGTYERYFEKDGVLYHHILNPQTGYPYENNLAAVTIISDHSADGDALSTACFALGLEKGLAFAESQSDVQAIFVTKDNEIYYTRDFESKVHAEKSEQRQ